MTHGSSTWYYEWKNYKKYIGKHTMKQYYLVLMRVIEHIIALLYIYI